VTRTGANALELSAQKVQTAQKCDANQPLMCCEGVLMTNWSGEKVALSFNGVAINRARLAVIDDNGITSYNSVAYPKKCLFGFSTPTTDTRLA